MRSRHADEFNHDPWAANYDRKVRDESNPIRAGYAELLAWTIAEARIGPTSVVMDLGSGTGNSAAAIPAAAKVLCVDISAGMAAQAPAKLRHLVDVEFLEADLLEVFDRPLPRLDALISTYAVHHLTEDEKPVLFGAIHASLEPGGRAVFGDLMFESEAARDEIDRAWQDDERRLVMRSLEEEFPWFVDRAVEQLGAAGFVDVETRRFSTLSWGIAATRG
jgi:putative AdoMet-dependent methyltransferase